MYNETNSNNHGSISFCSFERTDIIQISSITYKRFSTLSNDSLKAKGRFSIQLLLEDNTWSTRYNIAEKDRFSNSPILWTKLGSNFTVENLAIKLIYDEIHSDHAGMCSSNITRTHFVA